MATLWCICDLEPPNVTALQDQFRAYILAYALISYMCNDLPHLETSCNNDYVYVWDNEWVLHRNLRKVRIYALRLRALRRPKRKPPFILQPRTLQSEIDGFVATLDPLKQYRALRSLSQQFFTRNSFQPRVTRPQALYAATLLGQCFDNHSLTRAVDALKLQPSDLGPVLETHLSKSVYFSDKHESVPIVIDTGASISITPVRGDFIGNLEPATDISLNGLTGKAAVIGTGMVEWTIRDLFGVVRSIKTKAYFVPDAPIRLFSPQKLFQEKSEGSLLITSRIAELKLPEGDTLTFPFNSGSNLPLMLPALKANKIGVLFEDFQTLRDPVQTFNLLSVADETNQNLTAAQKELLQWHWRLGHCHFQWIQRLAARRTEAPTSPILQTRQQNVSACPNPICAACQLAKQNRRGPRTVTHHQLPGRDMALRQGDLMPGDTISIDQYMSTVRGRLAHTKGKELKKDKYVGGTIFVDHASGYIHLGNQVTLQIGDTLRSKLSFEQFAKHCGITLRTFRADNAPFQARAFQDDLASKGQTIDFSGTGAHHQNGIAERAIQTTSKWARAMLLHCILHWPDAADLELWPFALQHAVFLWNHLPSKHHLMAPIEIFTSTKLLNHDVLQRSHVWGCPCYVLEPKLQDGRSLPKWAPRSRRGQYLGISPQHSSTVGRILNHRTGAVTPQYHVVYDDMYTTVPNAQDMTPFNAEVWNNLIQFGLERSIDDDNFSPPLAPDWLTPQELEQQNREMAAQRHARIPTVQLPATVPEGDETDGPAQRPLQSEPVRTEPEIIVLPPTVAAEPEGEPANRRADPEGEPAIQPVEMERQDGEPVVRTRYGRQVRRNPRYYDRRQWANHVTSLTILPQRHAFSSEAPNYDEQDQEAKVKRSVLDNQFLQSLDWSDLTSFESQKGYSNWQAMLTVLKQAYNVHDDTFEDWHPLALATKANSEDTPTWDQAMNGPERVGYWEAAEREIATLESKEAWEVVPRESWMNVLPSTWAFRCKRFPDGFIRKLKARFCVRGDRQIEGQDFFETFAPVVNWTTVRLLLILSVVLGLATKQVDYTAAFIHAPIDKDPNWDSLSPEEQRRQGVYVAMPRGFTKPGKVLKLKKSLYGLKQAPRNFFQHLKGKLEGIGFTSATDVDPCLFISEKVICLVYVDDTLFYSPKEEYIQEVIEKLRMNEMELEVEDSVAGFLGVHLERCDDQGRIKLTQVGLTKRIVEALQIGHLPPKDTPTTTEPLTKDEDGDPADGMYNYASVVGMLQYLKSHARPEITFAVSQCARFTHSPRRSHEKALERIGQYLKGTMEQGLILMPRATSELDIECFVDADFAGLWPHEDRHDPVCVKSRTGFVICISNCPVIWTSKLQVEISMSTMEAEYVALSMAMKDLLPLMRTVKEVAQGVGISQEQITSIKTTVWEDNVGALTLANLEPGRMTPRSKFYAIKYHWFRSKLKPNKIKVSKIDTSKQKADIFTKPMRTDPFKSIRKILCGW